MSAELEKKGADAIQGALRPFQRTLGTETIR